VTRDQLDLAKKLAYYESEVDKAKRELGVYESQQTNAVSQSLNFRNLNKFYIIHLRNLKSSISVSLIFKLD
jgi:hypothetical protein